jgi:hypothetical protein
MAGEASLLGLPIELKGAVLEYVSDRNSGYSTNQKKAYGWIVHLL